VFADRETAARHRAAHHRLSASNDNEQKGAGPTVVELLYLRRGLAQAGGKLPLFDLDGQAISAGIVRHCLERGWSEPWFHNPTNPYWLVCKLTPTGRRLAEAS